MYRLKMNRVGEHWSKKTNFTRTFYGYPPTQAYIRLRVTGQSEEWEYQYLLRELLGDRLPVPRALSVFCGHGDLEVVQDAFEDVLDGLGFQLALRQELWGPALEPDGKGVGLCVSVT